MSFTIDKVEDLENMQKILHHFNNDFDPPISVMVFDLDEYAKKLLKYAENYIFLDKNGICGWVSFYNNDKKDKIGYLTQLVVEKRCRGLGLGKNMLEFFENDCKRKGMKTLRLEVQKRNIGAIRLYEGFGFKETKDLGKSFYMEKPVVL